MLGNLESDLKKVLLAGIGALPTTVEKSKAVSYTHLDVYKRQVYLLPNCQDILWSCNLPSWQSD